MVPLSPVRQRTKTRFKEFISPFLRSSLLSLFRTVIFQHVGFNPVIDVRRDRNIKYRFIYFHIGSHLVITQGYNQGPDLIDFVTVLSDNKHTRFVGTQVGGITLQIIFKQINVKSDIKVLRDTVILIDQRQFDFVSIPVTANNHHYLPRVGQPRFVMKRFSLHNNKY